MLGGYAWLARLADTARAEYAGTNGDYIAYCPMSMGFLNRIGVSRDEFQHLVEQGASDDDLLRYFDEHVAAKRREEANQFILGDSAEHLNAQDREEGRA